MNTFLSWICRRSDRQEATSLHEIQFQAARYQFDGTLIVHYRKGKAVKVEAGRPAQVEIVADPGSWLPAPSQALTPTDSPSTIQPDRCGP